MTIEELIERIIDAYAGATPEAMKTFKPVFLARLKHREGPKLDDAILEVLGAFQPKPSKPFPIPADFEAHLPSLRDIRKDDDERSIRADLDARTEKVRKLYRAWHADQGAKIKAARPAAVYGACVLEVCDRAGRLWRNADRIILSANDIALCEQSAVSCERVHRFGKIPASAVLWQAQCDEIRAAWANA